MNIPIKNINLARCNEFPEAHRFPTRIFYTVIALIGSVAFQNKGYAPYL